MRNRGEVCWCYCFADLLAREEPRYGGGVGRGWDLEADDEHSPAFTTQMWIKFVDGEENCY